MLLIFLERITSNLENLLNKIVNFIYLTYHIAS
jgi:hypothetical protein